MVLSTTTHSQRAAIAASIKLRVPSIVIRSRSGAIASIGKMEDPTGAFDYVTHRFELSIFTCFSDTG